MPDWFEWEREQVTKQVEESACRFEDDVDVHSRLRCWRFMHPGAAHLTHDVHNGFVLEVFCHRGDLPAAQPPRQRSLEISEKEER